MAGNAKKATDKPRPKYCDVLSSLMDENGDTQQSLADKLGVTRNVVLNWLNNRSYLDVENLCKLSDHYDVTTDYLLGRTTVKKNDASLRSAESFTGLSAEALTKLANIDYLDFTKAVAGHENETAQPVRLHVERETMRPSNMINKLILHTNFQTWAIMLGTTNEKAKQIHKGRPSYDRKTREAFRRVKEQTGFRLASPKELAKQNLYEAKQMIAEMLDSMFADDLNSNDDLFFSDVEINLMIDEMERNDNMTGVNDGKH